MACGSAGRVAPLTPLPQKEGAGWLPTVEGPQWEADRELTLDLRDVISERGVRS